MKYYAKESYNENGFRTNRVKLIMYNIDKSNKKLLRSICAGRYTVYKY